MVERQRRKIKKRNISCVLPSFLHIYNHTTNSTMDIKLKPELFQTDFFKDAFKEKLNGAKKFDYNSTTKLTGKELKHYHYYRAARGVLADMAFAMYLHTQNTPYKYNHKTGTRKTSTGVDFRLDNNIKVDVRAGHSFWKMSGLMRNGIDYVVVCSPVMDGLKGVYVKNGSTLLESYNTLFKSEIKVNMLGYQTSDRILEVGPMAMTYSLENMDTFIHDIKLMHAK